MFTSRFKAFLEELLESGKAGGIQSTHDLDIFLSAKKKSGSRLFPVRILPPTIGSLNGAASKPMLPGELLSMKPKSIWMRCPSRSTRILPLCLSFICKRYVTTLYPASDLIKFRCARAKRPECCSPYVWEEGHQHVILHPTHSTYVYVMIKQRHIAQVALGYSPRVLGFLNRMYGHGIRYGFNQAGTIPSDKYFKAVEGDSKLGHGNSITCASDSQPYPAINLFLLPNLPKALNQLRSQLLLTEICPGFDDDR